MTKTKKQLRAEAVERLKDAQTDNLEWMLLGDECPNWVNYDTLSYNKAVRERVADLLTDDDSTIPEADSTTESLSDVTDSREKSGNAVFVDGVQVFPPKALEHMADSRERLEADVLEAVKKGFITYETLIEWLDRQAAITERRMAKQWEEQASELVGQVNELQAKAGKLQGKLIDACVRIHELEEGSDYPLLRAQTSKVVQERDMYREKLSRALDLAHEIERLMP